MVSLGGCATGLLITDPAAPPIRITRDVDAIVQVMSLSDYHDLERRLRAQGFVEDMSADAPVCRGNGDYLMSHDIEDIVAVLDGRPEVFDEILQADELLKQELCSRFGNLLEDRRFVDALAGHMPADGVSQSRVGRVRSGLARLC